MTATVGAFRLSTLTNALDGSTGAMVETVVRKPLFLATNDRWASAPRHRRRTLLLS
jgi:hypothetical protein